MNFSSSQDKSIEDQLSMGIRFFDLRIAHKPKDSSSDLYFTHVIYTHLTVLVRMIILNKSTNTETSTKIKMLLLLINNY